MEVGASYKHTDAGVIPVDWEVKLLNQLVLLTNGEAHENYIKENGKYIVANSKFISSGGKVKKYSDYCLAPAEYRSVLMVMSDVPNGKAIAKCFLVDKDNYYTVNQRVCSLKARADIPEFLFYAIDRNKYFLAFDDGAQQTNLRKDDILKCLVAVPPTLREQSAIAAALSDADALINSLEKLIAKKRNIKKGAMQLLLTGKKRLPGFSGEWETKRIGDIFSIKVGKSLSRYIFNEGSYIVVDMGSVSTEGKLLLTKTTDFKGDFLDSGDLVMPKDDIGGGNIIGKIAYIDANNRYVLGDHVYAMKRKQGYSRFFSYLINSYHTNMSFRKKVAGSVQLGLSRKSVEEQEVYFPCIEEQTTIAQVLSDIDAEIEALEKKLSKYRLIKQGMMQELLTGKKRLI